MSMLSLLVTPTTTAEKQQDTHTPHRNNPLWPVHGSFLRVLEMRSLPRLLTISGTSLHGKSVSFVHTLRSAWTCYCCGHVQELLVAHAVRPVGDCTSVMEALEDRHSNGMSCFSTANTADICHPLDLAHHGLLMSALRAECARSIGAGCLATVRRGGCNTT